MRFSFALVFFLLSSLVYAQPVDVYFSFGTGSPVIDTRVNPQVTPISWSLGYKTKLNQVLEIGPQLFYQHSATAGKTPSVSVSDREGEPFQWNDRQALSAFNLLGVMMTLDRILEDGNRLNVSIGASSGIGFYFIPYVNPLCIPVQIHSRISYHVIGPISLFVVPKLTAWVKPSGVGLRDDRYVGYGIVAEGGMAYRIRQ